MSGWQRGKVFAQPALVGKLLSRHMQRRGVLGKPLDVGQAFRFFFKDRDEFVADDLSLLFRMGNTFQLVEELAGCIDGMEVHFGFVPEEIGDLFELVQPQKAVVHEYTVEPFTERAVKQHGDDRGIDAARKAGADSADAMAAEGSSLSIEVRDGTLEHAERSEGVDIGLRVFVGQRQAQVSSSDTRAETLTAMAERAVAMAKEAPEDPYAGLADADQLAQNWDLAALQMADPSAEPAPDQLQQDALAAESACAAIEGITQVQSAAAGYGRQHRAR